MTTPDLDAILSHCRARTGRTRRRIGGCKGPEENSGLRTIMQKHQLARAYKILEAIRVHIQPREHHANCNSRVDKACDCYGKSRDEVHDLLDELELILNGVNVT